MTFPYLPWTPRQDRSAPAVRDDAITLSYGELDDWSAAVAGKLAAQGFGEGSVLAVMLPNRVELVVAMLAAWRLGGIATPVNSAFTAAEAEFQINDCEVPVAYVQAYPGTVLDVESLVAHCRRSLAKVKVPESITIVDELPKNPVGKPDKPALRRIAAETVSAAAAT